MAKGPKGERRAAETDDGKNAAAVALGQLGGRRALRACRPGSARRLLEKLP